MENSAIKPDQPRMYGPLAAIVITIGIYFGAQLFSGVLLAVVPSLLGWGAEHTSAWLENSAWAQFLFIAIAETLTLFVLYKFLKKRKATFKDLGLSTFRAEHIAQAVTGFVLYFVLYIAILAVASKLLPGLNIEQKQELGFDMTAHGQDLWAIFISLVILPPITEEIVVRGFLFSGLRTKLTPFVAALVASTLFAAAHLGEGGKSGLLWIAGIDTFILSMVLCYLRTKTSSLWPCIGVHMIKNGLAFVLLFNIVQYFK